MIEIAGRLCQRRQFGRNKVFQRVKMRLDGEELRQIPSYSSSAGFWSLFGRPKPNGFPLAIQDS
jgi:hypothetical protein